MKDLKEEMGYNKKKIHISDTLWTIIIMDLAILIIILGAFLLYYIDTHLHNL